MKERENTDENMTKKKTNRKLNRSIHLMAVDNDHSIIYLVVL